MLMSLFGVRVFLCVDFWMRIFGGMFWKICLLYCLLMGILFIESYVGCECVLVMDVFEYNFYMFGNWVNYFLFNV